MGGENAPRKTLEGAALALDSYPDLRFLLFGDEQSIKPLLSKLPNLEKFSQILHTSDVIQDTDKPSQALRQGRSSSMRLAINAVKDGHADAVVSSGNTGAYMAMSKFVLKTFSGIDRPAIASLIPSGSGEFVALDLGANTACDAQNLEQFAYLGAAYAKCTLGLSSPRLGILNIGEEEQKGLAVLQEAASALRDSEDFNFVGFVEADEIMQGGIDVVVTDGFTGNVVLKTIEGTAKLMKTFLTQAFSSSLRSKLGYVFSRPAFRFLAQRINPSHYNGAIFLGLNGIAIKSHGKTDSLGFASAISAAVDMMQYDFKGTVANMLEAAQKNGDVDEISEPKIVDI